MKVFTVVLAGGAYLALAGSSAYAACPNEQFRTGPSMHLPDCRAYELVTPAHLNGIPQPGMGNSEESAAFATPPVLPSGDRYVWSVTATGIPGTESNGYTNLYAAIRTAAGWTNTRESPTAAQAEGSRPGSFSSDHQYSLHLVAGYSGGSLAFATCGSCLILYVRHPDGTYHLLGEGTVPTATDTDGFANGFIDELYPSARWISPGGDHQVFRSFAPLTPETLENQPVEGYNWEQVFDRTPTGLKLVSVLPNGTVPLEAAFAGSSQDGTTVLFLTREGNLYARLDNARTVELASGIGGEIHPGGITPDGSRAFFVQEGSIYYYDFATETVHPVVATGNAWLVRVSADGSHAYFISESEIEGQGTAGEYNLYVWDGTSTDFIAKVSGEDLEHNERGLIAWSGPAREPAENANPSLNTSRTTADGRVFVFESEMQLTDYPTEGHIEIYRYDGTPGEVTCVSCNPNQPASTGNSELVPSKVEPGGFKPNVQLEVPNLSDDGRQIVFESRGALLPADVNGAEDVYEWRDGSLSLISTGHAVQPSELFGVTPSGNDVFFETGEKLVGKGQETGSLAIYDARVGGGLVSQQSAQPLKCVGDACQGQPGQAPPLAALGSSTLAGKGNLKPKRCRHHRRKHRHHHVRKRSKSGERKASKPACRAGHRRAGK